jgi:hypothetical protein
MTSLAEGRVVRALGVAVLLVAISAGPGFGDPERNSGDEQIAAVTNRGVATETKAAPTGASVLYAPSDDDNPSLRSAIAALVGGPVDYFDARIATPSVATLEQYDCVLTYPYFAYLDNIAMGDNLAAAVDGGTTTVILGSWSVPTAGNSLAGAILTSGYCPVMTPTGSTTGTVSSWDGTGVAAFTEGVADFESPYRDELALQGSGAVYSHYIDGEIAIASRYPDWRVTYLNGFTGVPASTGDWPMVVANSCRTGSFNVLVLDGGTDNAYAVLAASTLAANYSVVDESQFNAFLTAGDRGWDLVLVDVPSTPPQGGWGDLIAYANSGGPVVMSFWDWGNNFGAGDPALFGLFGFTSATPISLAAGDVYDQAATPPGVYAHAGVAEMPHSSWSGSWTSDGDVFGLAAGSQTIGVLNSSEPVVIQNAGGNAIAAFLIDSWAGDGAETLWRNLALRVLPRSDLDGAALSVDWRFPDIATTLESHPLVAGPMTDLTDAQILNSSNFQIDLRGPYLQFEILNSSPWTSVGFNGWQLTDLNGELPSFVGATLDFVSPGVTGMPPGAVRFDADWARVNFSGALVTAGDRIRIKVVLGLFGDGFESNDTSRWSATVP